MARRIAPLGLALCFVVLMFACLGPTGPQYDVLIRNGTIYDGSGRVPFVGDIGINGDRIAAIGPSEGASGRVEVDASGLAVAPGFVNMLSWATESLIIDGRSQGDIRQGVTLEVFGEGWSMGPLNETMKAEMVEGWIATFGSAEAAAAAAGLDLGPGGELEVPWTTLGEYLEFLEAKGVAPNIASFVGATTVRIHEIGYEDRPPTPEELVRMQALVLQAMEEGAMGVGSSLIYAPAFYADINELIALNQVVAETGGMYISHLRSEGNRLLESVDELLRISLVAGVPAEIYHLKAGGESNWPKMDEVIAKVEAARADHQRITADMYTYTAGSTGLDAAMPPWVQEGGYDAWAERLKDPEIRARVANEMVTPTDEWENLFLAAGASGTLLVGFQNPELRKYTGKTLAEVAMERGTNVAETAIDLVIEDGTRVQVVYFLMSEDNVRKQVALPWVSFASDAGSLATEGVFLETSTHPRAYGNFARLLGRYVREEGIIPLEEAIRKLSFFPATNLGIKDRGLLKINNLADVVVFDPATIIDHATFEDPHQYSTGMLHVFVNGTQVLKDGEHTGATPGRVIRGLGWKEQQQ
jgi:N-acyl-D-amino-acid deacylase